VSSLDKFNLKGQRAIVTGAFGKLGAVWCQALLEAKAHVVAMDRPGATVSPTIEALQKTYGEALLLVEADITDRAALDQVRTQLRKDGRSPSILINNAGLDQPPGKQSKAYTLTDIPSEVFESVFSVNTFGAFQCMQVFGEDMIKARHGSIINIGSLYASVSPNRSLYDHIQQDPPFLKPPAYGASKAALINLTRYFAAHWGPYNIRVNALSPGGVLGDQDEQFKQKFCEKVPLNRMANFDDLVGPLLFLSSPASAYVTGTELLVDGGFTVW